MLPKVKPGICGPHANEILIGKALKQLPRDKVQLATKFGMVRIEPNQVVVNGSPEYVLSCCEASLKRLDVDYIDLYYQQRIDTSVPIEDTMEELKKLVKEGKIRHIGLSEASPETIRRAHAVHPITAIQMEWSLWTREIEEEIVPLCRELGIGIVPYSPLGRGFFGGIADAESLPANSFLYRFERKEEEWLRRTLQVPRVQLGSQGFEVSKLGFGCTGFTGINNNAPVSEELAVSIIKHAFDKGITFFDTSDICGPHTNEVLVGKALKQLPRDEVQLATKFGMVRIEPNQVIVNGTPEYARSCCEASLKRLGVNYIDLYYQHRIDTSVPIEDTMEELRKLVNEGKIKYIGLSEASPETIRRAHAVHPITAVQMEWNLWTREIEEEIVPLCRELGIGIVTYSPLGRGFFAGKAMVESLPANSFLQSLPRCQGDNLEKNKILFGKVQYLAEKHGCTPAQLALAWIVHQADHVVPIPGTTKTKNIDANVGSLRVKLTNEDLQEISDMVPINAATGNRVSDSLIRCSWKFANTPPKASNATKRSL